MVGEPQLIVLDEPTSALDPVGRADVRQLVLDMRANGTAVLLNSHLIGEVERVCDRITILDHGQVAADGTLDDLLGQSELKLQLGRVDAAVTAMLAGYGEVRDLGDGWVVVRGADPEQTPYVVRDLVQHGVAVFAVEHQRITLEERLLAVLRPRNAPGEEH
jgi:ABC-2 type transport system ATP-binding protein